MPSEPSFEPWASAEEEEDEEVTKLALSRLGKQNIGRLDISVDDVLRVQVDLWCVWVVWCKKNELRIKNQKAELPRTKPLRDSAMIAAICCSENVFAGIEAIKSFTAPPPQNSIKIWKRRNGKGGDRVVSR